MDKPTGPNADFFRGIATWKPGRMNRVDYFSIFFLLKGLGDLIDLMPLPDMVAFVIALVFLWFGIGAMIGRLHDIGMSGWWSILVFGLMVSSILMLKIMQETGQSHPSYLLAAIFPALGAGLFLFLWRGQKESNKYGDPYAGSKALGWKPAQK